MAKLLIRKDEDPILRKISKPIDKVTDRIKVLAEDMIETMHEENGVGLAGVQVGKLRQILVYDLYDEKGSKVLINPEIVEKNGSQVAIEGCLSLPEQNGYVRRYKTICVKAMNLEEENIEFTANDFEARVIQHEMDHLRGVLITDLFLEEDEINPNELEEMEVVK